MPVITNIDDLKQLYRRRVPKMFYDYCESGSWTEQTFRENTSDFDRIRLRQRVAVDMTGRNQEWTMLGQKVTMPVALAPVGSTGMQCPDGEVKAARAAGDFGVPFTLSTMSICSIEDVSSMQPHPFWFQLYVLRDPEFVENIIDRAKKANVSAMVLTLDLQILGQRHKDLKNQLSAPPKYTPRMVWDMATKWGWSAGMARTPRRTFGNIVGHAKGVDDLSSLALWASERFEPRLDWSMVRKIKEMWGGKLVLKGILDPEDARMAADVGADALVVSNHGGRQLDGALSSIRVLPSVVRAVGDQVDVWLDSGIRSGQDVLKALALGARGTMIGRSYIYGLGAMGEAGVTRALQVIQKEMDITMALCGVRTIADVRRTNDPIVLVPEDFEGRWA
jgi:L-lactate dehydrogenase (cytochrome)